MKKVILDFLKKYYVLMLVSLIHPIAVATDGYWGHTIIVQNATVLFRTYELYLICILPILHFVYGCVTYMVTKKIIVPIAVPTVIYMVGFSILAFRGFIFTLDNFLTMIILALFPIVFAWLGILVTLGIYHLIKATKESE